MLKMPGNPLLPIGVDVGADSIKIIQLRVNGEQLAVHCAAREPMPASPGSDLHTRTAAAVSVVRQALRENEFRGRGVIMTLPREMVHLKTMRLPPMPPSETASAVELEARNLFPFDTDGATVCHLPAGEVRQGNETKQELMVVAAKNQEVEQLVEIIHGGGLIVESLDYEPCAIYRSIERFMRRKEDDHDVHAFVDIGFRRSQVIIGKGRDISLIKPIEIGGQHLRDAVSRKLGITAEEAVALRKRLSEAQVNDPSLQRDTVRQAVYDVTRGVIEDLGREVALCLRYYSVTFRGARPGKVRVIGGEASDPYLLHLLNNSLSIPVEIGRAIDNADCSAMRPTLRKGAMSDWSLAMGLSLKGTDKRFAGREGRARGQSAETEAALNPAVTALRAANEKKNMEVTNA